MLVHMVIVSVTGLVSNAVVGSKRRALRCPVSPEWRSLVILEGAIRRKPDSSSGLMEVRWLFNNEATAHSNAYKIRSSRLLNNMFDSSQIKGWVTDPELSEDPMMATRSGAIAVGRLSWVFGG